MLIFYISNTLPQFGKVGIKLTSTVLSFPVFERKCLFISPLPNDGIEQMVREGGLTVRRFDLRKWAQVIFKQKDRICNISDDVLLVVCLRGK